MRKQRVFQTIFMMNKLTGIKLNRIFGNQSKTEKKPEKF